jgi:hypothetical protein
MMMMGMRDGEEELEALFLARWNLSIPVVYLITIAGLIISLTWSPETITLACCIRSLLWRATPDHHQERRGFMT